MDCTNPPKTPPLAQMSADEVEASALSNEQRRELVEKAGRGKITADETELLAHDIERATKKAHLASKQAARPNDPQYAVYAGPAIRAASATASLSQMTPVLTGIAVKYKRDRHNCGAEGGNKLKEKSAHLHKRVITAAHRLRENGTPDRKLVSELKDNYDFGKCDKQLRTILQTNGVLPPPKQKRKRK